MLRYYNYVGYSLGCCDDDELANCDLISGLELASNILKFI